jgi:hypothetical protein
MSTYYIVLFTLNSKASKDKPHWWWSSHNRCASGEGEIRSVDFEKAWENFRSVRNVCVLNQVWLMNVCRWKSCHEKYLKLTMLKMSHWICGMPQK